MLKVPLKGETDFSDSSFVTKPAVDQMITWVSSAIEMQFSMAGYKIPLAAVSGETWPTSQTTYLQFVTTLGTAAMAGGHSLKPAPAVAPGRPGSSGNLFQDLYDREMRKIYDFNTNRTMLRFRADYYSGSPAEMALNTPLGPTTDFLEGKFDPMRQLPLFDVADRIIAIQQEMKDLYLKWDYLYDVFDLDKGFGTALVEVD